MAQNPRAADVNSRVPRRAHVGVEDIRQAGTVNRPVPRRQSDLLVTGPGCVAAEPFAEHRPTPRRAGGYGRRGRTVRTRTTWSRNSAM